VSSTSILRELYLLPGQSGFAKDLFNFPLFFSSIRSGGSPGSLFGSSVSLYGVRKDGETRRGFPSVRETGSGGAWEILAGYSKGPYRFGDSFLAVVRAFDVRSFQHTVFPIQAF